MKKLCLLLAVVCISAASVGCSEKETTTAPVTPPAGGAETPAETPDAPGS